jgi:hypothetical protein
MQETTKAGSNPVKTLWINKAEDRTISLLAIRFRRITPLPRIHAKINAITAALRLPCLGRGLLMAESPILTSAGPKIPRAINGATDLCPSR